MADFPGASGLQDSSEQLQLIGDILGEISTKLDTLNEDNTKIINLLKASLMGIEIISDQEELIKNVEED